jgi:hypothetical protein
VAETATPASDRYCPRGGRVRAAHGARPFARESTTARRWPTCASRFQPRRASIRTCPRGGRRARARLAKDSCTSVRLGRRPRRRSPRSASSRPQGERGEPRWRTHGPHAHSCDAQEVTGPLRRLRCGAAARGFPVLSSSSAPCSWPGILAAELLAGGDDETLCSGPVAGSQRRSRCRNDSSRDRDDRAERADRGAEGDATEPERSPSRSRPAGGTRRS